MSELLDSLKGAVDPALTDYLGAIGKNYMDEVLAGGSAASPAILAHLDKAAEYKLKAISESDEATRRAYVDGIADELASAKTIAVSEGVALSEEAAATFVAGFKAVLGTVGSVAKGVITTVGSALVSGAIKGLTGGGGFDPSSIFPGA